MEVGTKVVKNRAGYRDDGRGDRWREAGALGQVGRLDRVHDQPARHPVERDGQADRVVEAEPVRTRRPVPAPGRSTTKRWT